ncbi:hypothetical protein [Streptomyces sp. NPDC050535]|uniref:hypothetical protein n=1 Tax=Streptomyces sp. NPDC050535 TaxID=3365626 RepID=UPI0037A0AFA3
MTNSPTGSPAGSEDYPGFYPDQPQGPWDFTPRDPTRAEQPPGYHPHTAPEEAPSQDFVRRYDRAIVQERGIRGTEPPSYDPQERFESDLREAELRSLDVPVQPDRSLQSEAEFQEQVRLAMAASLEDATRPQAWEAPVSAVPGPFPPVASSPLAADPLASSPAAASDSRRDMWLATSLGFEEAANRIDLGPDVPGFSSPVASSPVASSPGDANFRRDMRRALAVSAAEARISQRSAGTGPDVPGFSGQTAPNPTAPNPTAPSPVAPGPVDHNPAASGPVDHNPAASGVGFGPTPRWDFHAVRVAEARSNAVSRPMMGSDADAFGAVRGTPAAPNPSDRAPSNPVGGSANDYSPQAIPRRPLEANRGNTDGQPARGLERGGQVQARPQGRR